MLLMMLQRFVDTPNDFQKVGCGEFINLIVLSRAHQFVAVT